MRDVVDGTPHDPSVPAQDHSPEFVSTAASDDFVPKIPRANPNNGLQSHVRLRHSGRGSDLSFSAFMRKHEPKPAIGSRSLVCLIWKEKEHLLAAK